MECLYSPHFVFSSCLLYSHYPVLTPRKKTKNPKLKRGVSIPVDFCISPPGPVLGTSGPNSPISEYVTAFLFIMCIHIFVRKTPECECFTEVLSLCVFLVLLGLVLS